MTDQLDKAPVFPIPRQCPFHPAREYGDMRKMPGAGEVRMWDGSIVKVFTRYDDVKNVLADNRFSGNPATEGFPSLSPARDAVLDAEPAFIRFDPPEHGRHRRMLTREFMVKRIAALRPHIENTFLGLLRDLKARGNTAELNEDLFLPFTSTVIADLLDVPHRDHKFFQEKSVARVLLDVDPEIPKAASKAILDYLEKLVADRVDKADGRDDIISHLIVDQLREGHLTQRELVVMADLLLMAGHETTANQMALGLHSLLTHPDQLALMRKDPELVKSAVEEMLRFHTIVHFNAFRAATEDVEVNGELIPKGQGVIALIAAANRDPEVFERPDEFDITRKADHHVAFSYGIHQCLGQPLARAELYTVFSTIFDELPNLRLAVPAEEIQTKGDHFVLGLKSLPVVWDNP
ncbi:cytochrome P450 [Paracoccus sp. J55]|uniref:cytochrome P450 n=1 Tax=Paracoccus sp. J55 TaxID=935849 RepID=UPI0004BB0C6E|nr:cytochrome P450 [Paracoccus sp. J55]